ncbi:hypothetical protein MCOR25_008012 [Pyricularia grisea]|nr:hypothetical protein MCOR25_008012 [Pyricularia grisea]
MVFVPPEYMPKLPFDPPESMTIEEFMRNETCGRRPLAESRNPFTCGLTDKTYSISQVHQRTDFLSRALGKRMGWSPNQDTPWEKVVGIFSANTIDYQTVAYAVHRLNGIVTPANAVYSVPELAHQLKSSGASALVTCAPLLETALAAAKEAGIARDKVFVMWMPGPGPSTPIVSVDDLIREGSSLPELERLRWKKGTGARQTAFLCYSSGTSGLPKAVMISHRNVIANVLQYNTFDAPNRAKRGVTTQATLGLLPFSHIYGLVVICHAGTWRGDEIITLPKFELTTFLGAIQKFKIATLFVVPPIIIQMVRNHEKLKQYDLSSVHGVFSGAAPLGEETVGSLNKIYPKWVVTQGYGMTETATAVSGTSEDDIYTRSSGSLLPGVKAKVVDPDGKEITQLDTPGELWLQSPSVTLGYLNNEKATHETFVWDEDGRWIRTGDEVLFTLSPGGNEHLVILDRIKELIKVKGHQVAPAELEAHLLDHPAVGDCSVIQVPDDHSGEVPKAFVVKNAAYSKGKSDKDLAREIEKHVEEHKASYKWLRGGVEFVDEIPKSPSGKILRRLLRDREKEKRRSQGSKL